MEKIWLVDKLNQTDKECYCWSAIKVFKTKEQALKFIKEQKYPADYDTNEVDCEGF